MIALTLPPRIDLSNAATVSRDIQAASGGAMVLDASQVAHLGALGVQILLASARSWRAAGQSFTISPRSEAFDETLAQFGLTVGALQTEVGA